MSVEDCKKQICRSELHKVFQEFANREDVKKALEETIMHKRAGLLMKAFTEETGLKISRNYVYRVMKNKIPTTETVKIGKNSYEIIPTKEFNNTIV
jgi:intein-encoded DNA endonuclease-like protein